MPLQTMNDDDLDQIDLNDPDAVEAALKPLRAQMRALEKKMRALAPYTAEARARVARMNKALAEMARDPRVQQNRRAEAIRATLPPIPESCGKTAAQAQAVRDAFLARAYALDDAGLELEAGRDGKRAIEYDELAERRREQNRLRVARHRARRRGQEA
jgi:hypothetical protein